MARFLNQYYFRVSLFDEVVGSEENEKRQNLTFSLIEELVRRWCG